jgi:MATE family multidrug resistance protein
MAVCLGVGFMGLAAVAFFVIPRPIMEIYSRDPRILAMGMHILTIVAAFQIFDGCQTVATGALRGMGETRFPMLTNFAGYWLFGLPLGAVMCFKLKWGLSGLWTGLTLALIVIASLLLRRWQGASARVPG